MTPNILVLNAGSSSLKFSIFEVGEGNSLTMEYTGQIEGFHVQPRFEIQDAEGNFLANKALELESPAGFGNSDALNFLFEWLDSSDIELDIQGVGHRVVHGGSRFWQPVRLDNDVLSHLEKLIPLAPLHQPHNLNPIRRLLQLKPDIAQVACFDTAFHHTMPAVAQRFALPRRFHDAGVKRYGFHGLSYEYIASVLPEYLGKKAEGRVIVAHLGSGCSMCAIHHQKSVDSTMGFTALDGLPMGTRCGTLDVGVLLYLMEEQKMNLDEVTKLLYRQSGLLGVSGIGNDMRQLLKSDAEEAREAVELFVYQITRALGSLAAVLGGLDGLVFTAGIGTFQAPVRAMVCQQAKWLGIDLDDTANSAHGPQISMPDSIVGVWVIPTNEEKMIALHTHQLVFS
ncbi:MAG: acetate/propionate family kinase [SAR324 cluster bacterium]|nr:acetate/propionate family kinase [SAR324 cluster bacterium]